jgi:hypothetical protein
MTLSNWSIAQDSVDPNAVLAAVGWIGGDIEIRRFKRL